MFYVLVFSPRTLGKWSILTSIFFKGVDWNHQPESKYFQKKGMDKKVDGFFLVHLKKGLKITKWDRQDLKCWCFNYNQTEWTSDFCLNTAQQLLGMLKNLNLWTCDVHSAKLTWLENGRGLSRCISHNSNGTSLNNAGKRETVLSLFGANSLFFRGKLVVRCGEGKVWPNWTFTTPKVHFGITIPFDCKSPWNLGRSITKTDCYSKAVLSMNLKNFQL